MADEHGVICLQQHGDSMLPGHIVASGALHEALWSVNKVTSFVHSAEPIDSCEGHCLQTWVKHFRLKEQGLHL